MYCFVAKFGGKMNKANEKSILGRMEVLEEALQTALEALLEMQAEYRLLKYLILQGEKKNDER